MNALLCVAVIGVEKHALLLVREQRHGGRGAPPHASTPVQPPAKCHAPRVGLRRRPVALAPALAKTPLAPLQNGLLPVQEDQILVQEEWGHHVHKPPREEGALQERKRRLPQLDPCRFGVGHGLGRVLPVLAADDQKGHQQAAAAGLCRGEIQQQGGRSTARRRSSVVDHPRRPEVRRGYTVLHAFPRLQILHPKLEAAFL
mmetsp:Transcript_74307/g.234696  ORF Transcript_74307/g.234696 Transcript_74307/m.234696 type:complete len:201 (-) Transcript_74307:209-811(-)